RNAAGSQWTTRGTYATFRQLLQARARFLRMGFRVRNVREVCDDDGVGTAPTNTTPTSTTPSTPAALVALRQALLGREQARRWGAPRGSGRRDGPLWIAAATAAATTRQMGELLTELEATPWPAGERAGWEARRGPWSQEVGAATSFEKLETLRAE